MAAVFPDKTFFLPPPPQPPLPFLPPPPLWTADLLISVLTLKDLVCITTRDLLLLPAGCSAVFLFAFFHRTLWLKAARAQLRGRGQTKRWTDRCAQRFRAETGFLLQEAQGTRWNMTAHFQRGCLVWHCESVLKRFSGNFTCKISQVSVFTLHCRSSHDYIFCSQNTGGGDFCAPDAQTSIFASIASWFSKHLRSSPRIEQKFFRYTRSPLSSKQDFSQSNNPSNSLEDFIGHFHDCAIKMLQQLNYANDRLFSHNNLTSLGC